MVQKTLPTVAQVATQAAQEATSVAATQKGPAAAPSSTDLRLPSRDALRSYRSTVRVLQEGPFPASSQVVLEVTSAWQKEPEPMFHQMIRSGNPPQLTAEVYQTAQGLYARFGANEPWNFLAGTTYEEALAGQIDQGVLAFPTVWAMEMGGEGRPETYNGMLVVAYHWESQAPAVLAALPETWRRALGVGDAASARFAPRKVVADVKTTRDGWVLHAEVRFEGQWTLNGQTSPGQVAWVGEVTDINASFSIPLPEELRTQPPGSAEAPLPLPEAAQVEADTPQGAVYSIPGMTVQALMDFWTQTQGLKITAQFGDANAGGMLVAVQKADGNTVQVMIMTTDQGVRVIFVVPQQP